MHNVYKYPLTPPSYRFASLCIANLATTVAAQVKVIQAGAVRPLIALGTNAAFQIESRRYAVLALGKFYPIFFVTSIHGFSCECKHIFQANLTSTVANHLTIVEDGALLAFFSLCNSPDLMSQYYVGCALANLSCSTANHHLITEHGGIQALVRI